MSGRSSARISRRIFVVGMGASVAAWVARAFADASVRGTTTSSVAAAEERAKKSGKPIFAIVIPRQDDDKDLRGRVWGEYLNHASAAQLAPLGLAEVVCAPLADLPPAPGANDRDTLALVIAPAGKTTALAAKVPMYTWRAGEDMDALARRRIDIVADLVRRGLGAPPPDRVEALAATVVARVQRRPPPGAHWANAGGCGLDTVEDMEETEAIAIGCGMGHLPALSRRFLYFFSQTPGQRWNRRR